MKVDGTKEFEAPAHTVWEVLNDPTRLAQLLPGVQSFDVQDERHWTANVKVPLGMGGLALKFKFEKTEERPIEYARLSAKGQGVGAIVNMDTQFHLDAQGERTAMRWECDVRVAGPVGSMGQRVFQPIVNQQVTNVLNALERQVQDAKAAGAAAAEAGGETSGAPEGIHAGSPEAYSPEPEGPTHNTD